jgi:hypothetical protein
MLTKMQIPSAVPARVPGKFADGTELFRTLRVDAFTRRGATRGLARIQESIGTSLA